MSRNSQTPESRKADVSTKDLLQKAIARSRSAIPTLITSASTNTGREMPQLYDRNATNKLNFRKSWTHAHKRISKYPNIGGTPASAGAETVQLAEIRPESHETSQPRATSGGGLKKKSMLRKSFKEPGKIKWKSPYSPYETRFQDANAKSSKTIAGVRSLPRASTNPSPNEFLHKLQPPLHIANTDGAAAPAPGSSEPEKEPEVSEAHTSDAVDVSEKVDKGPTTSKKAKSPKVPARKQKKRNDNAATNGTPTTGRGMEVEESAAGISISMPAATASNSNVHTKKVKANEKSQSTPRFKASKSLNKRSKPKKVKVKDSRSKSEADYIRNLMGDSGIKLSKKRTKKALDFILSGVGTSLNGNSSSNSNIYNTGPYPALPATRPTGRFGPLTGTNDKEKLDKADTFGVGNNADAFVDFSFPEIEPDKRTLTSVAIFKKYTSKSGNAEVPDIKKLFKSEVKLPGIKNQNISLEFAGDHLVVIGYRFKDEKHNARKITEIVEIPSCVDINNLKIGRRPNGAIWIEEWDLGPESPEEKLKKAINIKSPEQKQFANNQELTAEAEGQKFPKTQ